MQPGTRFMAMFSVPAGTQLANGLNVNLLEAHKAANLKVITNEPEPADFTSTRALYATQLVRSGNWLNLVALMPASTEANGITLKLIADPATLGTEEVSLYMVYDNTVSQGASNNAVYYATFDVSTLIANPTTKKLTVHINTSNSTIPTIVEFNNLR